MDKTELRECPFCGANPVNISGGNGRIYWFDHPDNECLLSGHEFDCGNDGQWVDKWNRRALSSGEEVRGACAQICASVRATCTHSAAGTAVKACEDEIRSLDLSALKGKEGGNGIAKREYDAPSLSSREAGLEEPKAMQNLRGFRDAGSRAVVAYVDKLHAIAVNALLDADVACQKIADDSDRPSDHQIGASCCVDAIRALRAGQESAPAAAGAGWVSVPVDTLKRWEETAQRYWFSSAEGEDYNNDDVIAMSEEIKAFIPAAPREGE